LTPARRRGVEILDDPATPRDVRERSMADIARSNALFGGTTSAMHALRHIIPRLQREAVLLDVGTGLGDIPARAHREAASAGVVLTTLGLDVTESLLHTAREGVDAVVTAHALRLPFRDNSIDVVLCSQLLHHFADADAGRLIAELHRVSRGWVLISDLYRSWLAAGGFWLASVALGFHRVTRHDGVTSVLRGFTTAELEQLVSDTVAIRPTVRRSQFWRISATWEKH
jgi:SAM-dependent methyltransferase